MPPEIQKDSMREDVGTPVPLFPQGRLAERLRADNPAHLDHVVEIVRNGGAVALPFKGVYGIFGDVDSEGAAKQIVKAKIRPEDQKLIIVPLPEHIEEVANLTRSRINRKNFEDLLTEVHALGVILHAATTAPFHLVKQRDDGAATTLSIWAEDESMRYIVERARSLGGRALVGTSANKSGETTHWKFEPLCEDFKYDVDAVVAATPDENFLNLLKFRRKSTSVVDFTGEVPRLHRSGNVTDYELTRLLRKYHFSKMIIGRDVITVRPREYPVTSTPIAS